MTVRIVTLLSILLLSALDVGAETKDLSPPPLNPYPKEALHVTVTFDRPEDAKRYTIVMKALYQNQQSECGYIEPSWNRRFIYPEGTFEIPNDSRDPRQARFNIYLDRYNRDTCNWELASPHIRVRDTYTGRVATGNWGLDEDLVPGAEFKDVCPFRDSEHSLPCFGRGRPVPDTPFYNNVPANGRIPITVKVSEDSATMRPDPPNFFSNFVEPARSNGAPTPSANAGDNR
jgi:hypothetical protein